MSNYTPYTWQQKQTKDWILTKLPWIIVLIIFLVALFVFGYLVVPKILGVDGSKPANSN